MSERCDGHARRAGHVSPSRTRVTRRAGHAGQDAAHRTCGGDIAGHAVRLSLERARRGGARRGGRRGGGGGGGGGVAEIEPRYSPRYSPEVFMPSMW